MNFGSERHFQKQIKAKCGLLMVYWYVCGAKNFSTPYTYCTYATSHNTCYYYYLNKNNNFFFKKKKTDTPYCTPYRGP